LLLVSIDCFDALFDLGGGDEEVPGVDYLLEVAESAPEGVQVVRGGCLLEEGEGVLLGQVGV
jgi:hypothetical protein